MANMGDSVKADSANYSLQFTVKPNALGALNIPITLPGG